MSYLISEVLPLMTPDVRNVFPSHTLNGFYYLKYSKETISCIIMYFFKYSFVCLYFFLESCRKKMFILKKQFFYFSSSSHKGKLRKKL